MSCGVGRRRGLDPALLWLWCRLAAVAPIGPLAWEFPYATGVTIKRKKNKTMDIFICMTDSLCCTPETNITLYINYTSIK